MFCHGNPIEARVCARVYPALPGLCRSGFDLRGCRLRRRGPSRFSRSSNRGDHVRRQNGWGRASCSEAAMGVAGAPLPVLRYHSRTCGWGMWVWVGWVAHWTGGASVQASTEPYVAYIIVCLVLIFIG